MPIYEYHCRKCGHAFEHLARTLSAVAPACPKCGTPKPRKQLSVFSAAVAATRQPDCVSAGCPSAGSCASGKCPFH